MPTLSPNQLDKLLEIRDPLTRRRFTVFFQLPQDLQNSMLSEQTADSIWNITKEKYVLSDTNTSAVAKVIGLIFLGELPIKDFITALKNELGVDAQKAQAIAQDINTSIFQPVRNSLMEVHGLERGTTRNDTRIDAGGNRDANIRMRANDTNNATNIQNQISPPTREELLNRLRAQSNQPARPRIIDPSEPRPPLTPPARPDANSPYQARPAHYRAPTQRNVIDLRTARRKNSRRKYKGFFANY